MFQRSWFYLASVLLCATLICTDMQARAQEHLENNAPSSFSNGVNVKPGKASEPATQEQVANAILADTLSKLDAQTDVHFHEGEYDHIINLYRIIVEGDPKNMSAYENAAYLLWSTDRNPQAIEFLKQGIKNNPDIYYMYDELGNHYWLRNKDPKNAITYLRQAVQHTCPPTTWHSLANCYEKLGLLEQAVKAWERAAKYPNNSIAKIRLQRAKSELDQHNRDHA
jgi:tetratricopeptide (TPR) repeat protein